MIRTKTLLQKADMPHLRKNWTMMRETAVLCLVLTEMTPMIANKIIHPRRSVWRINARPRADTNARRRAEGASGGHCCNGLSSKPGDL